MCYPSCTVTARLEKVPIQHSSDGSASEVLACFININWNLFSFLPWTIARLLPVAKLLKLFSRHQLSALEIDGEGKVAKTKWRWRWMDDSSVIPRPQSFHDWWHTRPFFFFFWPRMSDHSSRLFHGPFQDRKLIFFFAQKRDFFLFYHNVASAFTKNEILRNYCIFLFFIVFQL